MPPRTMPAKNKIAQPQTTRCRYNAGGGQCRRIATVRGKLCRQHAAAINAELAARGESGGPVSDLIEGLITGNRQQTTAGIAGIAEGFMRAMGAQGSRPMPPRPGAHAQGRPMPPPPRQRPAEPPPPPPGVLERDVLGFTATEPLTVEKVKDRYKKLARVFHPDTGSGSEEKMRQLNAAYEALIELVK